MTVNGLYSSGDEHETEAHRFCLRAVAASPLPVDAARAPPSQAFAIGAREG
jgi:hypothetical protein